MIRTALKHFISEICIELVFDKLSSNFNIKPVVFNNIHDFFVGQRFRSIEIIGQNREIAYSTVIHVNILDEYITVRDDDNISFRIDKHDIQRLRFIQ